MVLVRGIHEKTQTTPAADLALAQRRMNEGTMTVGPPRDELEELFDELGELHALRAGVQKKVLAHDIKQAMKAKGISPSESLIARAAARRVPLTVGEPDSSPAIAYAHLAETVAEVVAR